MDAIKKFQNLAQEVGVTALDVGARRGVGPDLLSIASGVDYYGFEPDAVECEKLNSSLQFTPWKSLSFIPTALGESDGFFYLNLYRQRGCSSKLTAREKAGALFSRGDYYIHDDKIKVPTKSLDDLVKTIPINNPAYLKIDVQGMETEVFRGAARALADSIVAIRTEVNFFPLYDELPLFAEIDQALRPYGFVPMRFLELHEWRRNTRNKLPDLGPSSMPYSQGQVIHGDILYMLTPESFLAEDEVEIKRQIRLALIAVCYDHLDHAEAIFKKICVKRYCENLITSDPVRLLRELSRIKARQYKGVKMLGRKIYGKFFK